MDYQELARELVSIGKMEGGDLHIGSLKRLGITRADVMKVADVIGTEGVIQVSGLDYYVLKGVS